MLLRVLSHSLLVSPGLSLALLHCHVFNYHLCLGNSKCHFRFRLYPELSVSASSRFRSVRLSTEAHTHMFFLKFREHTEPYAWSYTEPQYQLHGASLCHPHPPQLCLLGLPLISHFLFLPSIRASPPNASSLSKPQQILFPVCLVRGCLFLETITERGCALTFFQPLRKGPRTP